MSHLLGTTLIFHILIFSCMELATRGSRVTLTPNTSEVENGTLTNFTCKVSCKLSATHTIKWFVGHTLKRVVDDGFTSRTGILANVTVLSSCTGPSDPGQEKQQLSIMASSAEKMNRTAIQCAALRKAPFYTDHFSYYSVILFKDKAETTMTSPPESSAQAGSNGDSSVQIQPTQCQTETVTVTVTQTVTLSPKCD